VRPREEIAQELKNNREKGGKAAVGGAAEGAKKENASSLPKPMGRTGDRRGRMGVVSTLVEFCFPAAASQLENKGGEGYSLENERASAGQMDNFLRAAGNKPPQRKNSQTASTRMR